MISARPSSTPGSAILRSCTSSPRVASSSSTTTSAYGRSRGGCRRPTAFRACRRSRAARPPSHAVDVLSTHHYAAMTSGPPTPADPLPRPSGPPDLRLARTTLRHGLGRAKLSGHESDRSRRRTAEPKTRPSPNSEADDASHDTTTSSPSRTSSDIKRLDIALTHARRRVAPARARRHHREAAAGPGDRSSTSHARPMHLGDALAPLVRRKLHGLTVDRQHAVATALTQRANDTTVDAARRPQRGAQPATTSTRCCPRSSRSTASSSCA